jgi:hypothetical protein
MLAAEINGRKNLRLSIPVTVLTVIDRLVHHAIILEMNTDSYRRKSAETSATKNPTANLKKAVDA